MWNVARFFRGFYLALFFLTIPLRAESQDRPASVLLQVPSINVQQIFAYGHERGFFNEQGVSLRIVVIKPHLATATLLSGEVQLTAQFQTAFYAGLRGAP